MPSKERMRGKMRNREPPERHDLWAADDLSIQVVSRVEALAGRRGPEESKKQEARQRGSPAEPSCVFTVAVVAVDEVQTDAQGTATVPEARSRWIGSDQTQLAACLASAWHSHPRSCSGVPATTQTRSFLPFSMP